MSESMTIRVNVSMSTVHVTKNLIESECEY